MAESVDGVGGIVGDEMARVEFSTDVEGAGSQLSPCVRLFIQLLLEEDMQSTDDAWGFFTGQTLSPSTSHTGLKRAV